MTRNPEQKRRTWQPTLRKTKARMQKKLRRPAQWRTNVVEKVGSKDNEGNNGNTDKNDTQETARATRVAHGNFRAARAQEKLGLSITFRVSTLPR